MRGVWEMKIAIIDDSKFMRRLITASIQGIKPDAQLTEFADAADALPAMVDLNPDLITLDMLMPRMSGLEFLERMRGAGRQPRVIVITADIQKSVRERCAECGVQDFIQKPITPEKLQASFSKLFQP